MTNPMRDYLEQRERSLEKRVAELEAALQRIIAWKWPQRLDDGFKDIARKALGLPTRG